MTSTQHKTRMPRPDWGTVKGYCLIFIIALFTLFLAGHTFSSVAVGGVLLILVGVGTVLAVIQFTRFDRARRRGEPSGR